MNHRILEARVRKAWASSWHRLNKVNSKCYYTELELLMKFVCVCMCGSKGLPDHHCALTTSRLHFNFPFRRVGDFSIREAASSAHAFISA